MKSIIFLLVLLHSLAESYNQTTEWNYIFYRTADIAYGQSLVIHLKKDIKYPSVLLAAAGSGKNPYFYYNTTIQSFVNNFDFYDSISWIDNKPNNYITIPYDSLQENYTIGIYKDSEEPIKYSVEFIAVENTTCYAGCNNNSECVNGICKCNGLWFSGYDCSVQFKELGFKKANSQILGAGSWQFFYLPFKESGSAVSAKFKNIQGNSRIYLLSNNAADSIPSMFNYEIAFWFSEAGAELAYTSGVINTDLWKISLFCYDNIPCKTELTFTYGDESSSSSSPNFTWLIVSIMISVTFLCFLIPIIIRLMIRFRNLRSTQVINAIANPLTPEEMQLAYPSKQWSSLNKDPDACAICLDDFEGITNVRILSCEHSFHAKCIDEWARTNAKCPLCKLSMVPLQTGSIPDQSEGSENTQRALNISQEIREDPRIDNE